MNRAVAAVLVGELAEARRTQKDLSAATGIPVPTLQRYLAEKPRAINIDTLDKITTALGVSPSQVMAKARKKLEASGEDQAARIAIRQALLDRQPTTRPTRRKP